MMNCLLFKCYYIFAMNHLPTIIQRTLIFLNIFVFLILSSAKGHCINHTAPENESERL